MQLTFSLDDNLFKELNNRLTIQNISLDEACLKGIELFLKSPVPRKTKTGTEEDYYGRAKDRIPRWALKPDQYNHKIIRAYFLSEYYNGGLASISNMRGLCSDSSHPELYIPDNSFNSNYNQMKFDGPKSHGKVFEDDGTNVVIWDEVKDILMQFKDKFCDL